MTARILYYALCFCFIAFALYDPEPITKGAAAMTGWFVADYGFMVLIICATFILCCLALLISPFRRVRIGGKEAIPTYSTLSWITMLFATGMGSGLVFYGAAEPLTHYINAPADVTPRNIPQAIGLSYFHWGFHAWAIYAVAGLSIAHICFKEGGMLTPAASLKQKGIARRLVNYVAIIAIVFGVVGALCMAVLQLSDGISRQLDLSRVDASLIKYAMLAALCIVFILSSCTGLGRGIKTLSNLNIAAAILLLTFVFFATWNLPYVSLITEALGEYGAILFHHSLRLFPSPKIAHWQQDWSISLFLWWVAWAPFVGVFIARISYGRTIKEFIIGVLCVPTLFSIIWFGIFGSAVLSEPSLQPELSALADAPQQVTYRLLNTLPYSEITTIVMLLLLFVFLVTSADSGAYVLAMFTSESHYTPTVRARLIWGVVLGATTSIILLSNGGINMIKSIAILGGIPYLFIMVWQLYVLLRDLMTKDSSAALLTSKHQ